MCLKFEERNILNLQQRILDTLCLMKAKVKLYKVYLYRQNYVETLTTSYRIKGNYV